MKNSFLVIGGVKLNEYFKDKHLEIIDIVTYVGTSSKSTSISRISAIAKDIERGI
jgi:hypothetical protein